jgi:hypothetical protein
VEIMHTRHGTDKQLAGQKGQTVGTLAAEPELELATAAFANDNVL